MFFERGFISIFAGVCLLMLYPMLPLNSKLKVYIVRTIVLFVISVCGITYSMAGETVIVNGVLKSRVDLPNNGSYFEFTTPEDLTHYQDLKNTSQHVPYEKLFPEGTEHLGPTKKLLAFRDFVYNSFCGDCNIKKQLAGKRIRISICVKPDGSTLLKEIICTDDLLNYVSAESIKHLISIVTSYIFTASNVSGKHYITMSAVITVPK